MFLHASILAAATTAPNSLPVEHDALYGLVNSEFFFPIAVLVLGALILLFGFKAYQSLVVFNFILLGFWVGSKLGERVQIATVSAVIGAVLLGAVSWPLMKYAVAVCGGLIGALVGMVIWAYFQYPMDLVWAGGLAGLILLGMLSFVLFKASIILFSSIQGAIMLVLGGAALLIRYTPWTQDLQNGFNGKPILMPLLVASLAILGLIYQQQKYGLLDSGGAGKSGGGGEAKPAKK